jgi:hypothetical protein
VSDENEPTLPDQALVVRGGRMSPPHVVKAAMKHAKSHPGEFGVSVRSRADYSEEELARRVVGSPYMVSTVGEIRALGGEVIASEREPGDAHADLIFPTRPTEADVETLSKAFEKRTK